MVEILDISLELHIDQSLLLYVIAVFIALCIISCELGTRIINQKVNVENINFWQSLNWLLDAS